MTSAFENLSGPGKPLRQESPDARELEGLIRTAHRKLTDARHPELSSEGRFDLAYHAAHSLSLAALRWHGYRCSNRYVVFQLLPHTLGLGPEVWRVLAKCHDIRNRSEYEGSFTTDDGLLAELMSACEILLDRLKAMPPIAGA
jgi:hypothetical protein